jgi:hypothetical protein
LRSLPLASPCRRKPFRLAGARIHRTRRHEIAIPTLSTQRTAAGSRLDGPFRRRSQSSPHRRRRISRSLRIHSRRVG